MSNETNKQDASEEEIWMYVVVIAYFLIYETLFVWIIILYQTHNIPDYYPLLLVIWFVMRLPFIYLSNEWYQDMAANRYQGAMIIPSVA